MIKAIVALLLADSAVSALVGERIRPVKFNQGQSFPMLEYSTDGVRKLDCRDPGDTYYGTVSIGILATDYAQLFDCTEAVRTCLDDFEGEVVGWSISIESGVENEEAEDQELGAYYKRLDFDCSGAKL